MAKRVKKPRKKRKVRQTRRARKQDQDTATAGLVVNIFIPGLGSIIGGRFDVGVIQLVLFLVGFALKSILIGIPLMIGAWIWALITGIQMLQDAK